MDDKIILQNEISKLKNFLSEHKDDLDDGNINKLYDAFLNNYGMPQSALTHLLLDSGIDVFNLIKHEIPIYMCKGFLPTKLYPDGLVLTGTIHINSSIDDIKPEAFARQEKLDKIYIDNPNIQRIFNNAFSRCGDLSIYFKNTKVRFSEVLADGLRPIFNTNLSVYCIDGEIRLR